MTPISFTFYIFVTSPDYGRKMSRVEK